ncbi:MAG: hypothetical protein PHW65_03270 [Dehalococcoidales bacterium]|nr:hypothetical protein [Dehalococcoidales bacterium]
MDVEEYLTHVNYPKFIIYESQTKLVMDSANSIRERNEIMRNLSGYSTDFKIRWDYYKEALKKANPKGLLIFRTFWYSCQITVRNELLRMARRGEL